MDASELSRIAATLLAAVAESRALAPQVGNGMHFRELVRHSREMHDLLVDALVECPPLATDHLIRLVDTTNVQITALEEFAAAGVEGSVRMTR